MKKGRAEAAPPAGRFGQSRMVELLSISSPMFGGERRKRGLSETTTRGLSGLVVFARASKKASSTVFLFLGTLLLLSVLSPSVLSEKLEEGGAPPPPPFSSPSSSSTTYSNTPGGERQQLSDSDDDAVGKGEEGEAKQAIVEQEGVGPRDDGGTRGTMFEPPLELLSLIPEPAPSDVVEEVRKGRLRPPHRAVLRSLTPIVAVFSAPVVPIGASLEGEGQQPAAFKVSTNSRTGRVAGRGYWATTSIYRWDPDEPWKTDLIVTLQFNQQLVSERGQPLLTSDEPETMGRYGGASFVTGPLSVSLRSVHSKKASEFTEGRWRSSFRSADLTTSLWHEVPDDGEVTLFFNSPVDLARLRKASLWERFLRLYADDDPTALVPFDVRRCGNNVGHQSRPALVPQPRRQGGGWGAGGEGVVGDVEDDDDDVRCVRLTPLKALESKKYLLTLAPGESYSDASGLYSPKVLSQSSPGGPTRHGTVVLTGLRPFEFWANHSAGRVSTVNVSLSVLHGMCSNFTEEEFAAALRVEEVIASGSAASQQHSASLLRSSSSAAAPPYLGDFQSGSSGGTTSRVGLPTLISRRTAVRFAETGDIIVTAGLVPGRHYRLSISRRFVPSEVGRAALVDCFNKPLADSVVEIHTQMAKTFISPLSVGSPQGHQWFPSMMPFNLTRRRTLGNTATIYLLKRNSNGGPFPWKTSHRVATFQAAGILRSLLNEVNISDFPPFDDEGEKKEAGQQEGFPPHLPSSFPPPQDLMNFADWTPPLAVVDLRKINRDPPLAPSVVTLQLPREEQVFLVQSRIMEQPQQQHLQPGGSSSLPPPLPYNPFFPGRAMVEKREMLLFGFTSLHVSSYISEQHHSTLPEHTSPGVDGPAAAARKTDALVVEVSYLSNSRPVAGAEVRLYIRSLGDSDMWTSNNAANAAPAGGAGPRPMYMPYFMRLGWRKKGEQGVKTDASGVAVVTGIDLKRVAAVVSNPSFVLVVIAPNRDEVHVSYVPIPLVSAVNYWGSGINSSSSSSDPPTDPTGRLTGPRGTLRGRDAMAWGVTDRVAYRPGDEFGFQGMLLASEEVCRRTERSAKNGGAGGRSSNEVEAEGDGSGGASTAAGHHSSMCLPHEVLGVAHDRLLLWVKMWGSGVVEEETLLLPRHESGGGRRSACGAGKGASGEEGVAAALRGGGGGSGEEDSLSDDCQADEEDDDGDEGENDDSSSGESSSPCRAYLVRLDELASFSMKKRVPVNVAYHWAMDFVSLVLLLDEPSGHHHQQAARLEEGAAVIGDEDQHRLGDVDSAAFASCRAFDAAAALAGKGVKLQRGGVVASVMRPTSPSNGGLYITDPRPPSAVVHNLTIPSVLRPKSALMVAGQVISYTGAPLVNHSVTVSFVIDMAARGGGLSYWEPFFATSSPEGRAYLQRCHWETDQEGVTVGGLMSNGFYAVVTAQVVTSLSGDFKTALDVSRLRCVNAEHNNNGEGGGSDDEEDVVTPESSGSGGVEPLKRPVRMKPLVPGRTWDATGLLSPYHVLRVKIETTGLMGEWLPSVEKDVVLATMPYRLESAQLSPRAVMLGVPMTLSTKIVRLPEAAQDDVPEVLTGAAAAAARVTLHVFRLERALPVADVVPSSHAGGASHRRPPVGSNGVGACFPDRDLRFDDYGGIDHETMVMLDGLDPVQSCQGAEQPCGFALPLNAPEARYLATWELRMHSSDQKIDMGGDDESSFGEDAGSESYVADVGCAFLEPTRAMLSTRRIEVRVASDKQEYFSGQPVTLSFLNPFLPMSSVSPLMKRGQRHLLPTDPGYVPFVSRLSIVWATADAAHWRPKVFQVLPPTDGNQSPATKTAAEAQAGESQQGMSAEQRSSISNGGDGEGEEEGIVRTSWDGMIHVSAGRVPSDCSASCTVSVLMAPPISQEPVELSTIELSEAVTGKGFSRNNPLLNAFGPFYVEERLEVRVRRSTDLAPGKFTMRILNGRGAESAPAPDRKGRGGGFVVASVGGDAAGADDGGVGSLPGGESRVSPGNADRSSSISSPGGSDSQLDMLTRVETEQETSTGDNFNFDWRMTSESDAASPPPSPFWQQNNSSSDDSHRGGLYDGGGPSSSGNYASMATKKKRQFGEGLRRFQPGDEVELEFAAEVDASDLFPTGASSSSPPSSSSVVDQFDWSGDVLFSAVDRRFVDLKPWTPLTASEIMFQEGFGFRVGRHLRRETSLKDLRSWDSYEFAREVLERRVRTNPFFSVGDHPYGEDLYLYGDDIFLSEQAYRSRQVTLVTDGLKIAPCDPHHRYPAGNCVGVAYNSVESFHGVSSLMMRKGGSAGGDPMPDGMMGPLSSSSQQSTSELFVRRDFRPLADTGRVRLQVVEAATTPAGAETSSAGGGKVYLKGRAKFKLPHGTGTFLIKSFLILKGEPKTTSGAASNVCSEGGSGGGGGAAADGAAAAAARPPRPLSILRFGKVEDSLISRKPVFIKPYLPRVLRIGDKAQFGVIVEVADPHHQQQRSSSSPFHVVVEIEDQGPVSLDTKEDNHRRVVMNDGETASTSSTKLVLFRFSANRLGKMPLRFSIYGFPPGTNGVLLDSVEEGIEVLPNSPPITVSTIRPVSPDAVCPTKEAASSSSSSSAKWTERQDEKAAEASGRGVVENGEETEGDATSCAVSVREGFLIPNIVPNVGGLTISTGVSFLGPMLRRAKQLVRSVALPDEETSFAGSRDRARTSTLTEQSSDLLSDDLLAIIAANSMLNLFYSLDDAMLREASDLANRYLPQYVSSYGMSRHPVKDAEGRRAKHHHGGGVSHGDGVDVHLTFVALAGYNWMMRAMRAHEYGLTPHVETLRKALVNFVKARVREWQREQAVRRSPTHGKWLIDHVGRQNLIDIRQVLGPHFSFELEDAALEEALSLESLVALMGDNCGNLESWALSTAMVLDYYPTKLRADGTVDRIVGECISRIIDGIRVVGGKSYFSKGPSGDQPLNDWDHGIAMSIVAGRPLNNWDQGIAMSIVAGRQSMLRTHQQQLVEVAAWMSEGGLLASQAPLLRHGAGISKPDSLAFITIFHGIGGFDIMSKSAKHPDLSVMGRWLKDEHQRPLLLPSQPPSLVTAGDVGSSINNAVDSGKTVLEESASSAASWEHIDDRSGGVVKTNGKTVSEESASSAASWEHIDDRSGGVVKKDAGKGRRSASGDDDDGPPLFIAKLTASNRGPISRSFSWRSLEEHGLNPPSTLAFPPDLQSGPRSVQQMEVVVEGRGLALTEFEMRFIPHEAIQRPAYSGLLVEKTIRRYSGLTGRCEGSPTLIVQSGSRLCVVIKVTMRDSFRGVVVEDRSAGGLEPLELKLNNEQAAAALLFGSSRRHRHYFSFFDPCRRTVKKASVSWFCPNLFAGTHVFAYVANANFTGLYGLPPAISYVESQRQVMGSSGGALGALAVLPSGAAGGSSIGEQEESEDDDPSDIYAQYGVPEPPNWLLGMKPQSCPTCPLGQLCDPAVGKCNGGSGGGAAEETVGDGGEQDGEIMREERESVTAAQPLVPSSLEVASEKSRSALRKAMSTTTASIQSAATPSATASTTASTSNAKERNGRNATKGAELTRVEEEEDDESGFYELGLMDDDQRITEEERPPTEDELDKDDLVMMALRGRFGPNVQKKRLDEQVAANPVPPLGADDEGFEHLFEES